MKFTNNKIFENGKTELLLCERCNNLVNMQIIKSSSSLGTLGFSLFNYKTEYFVFCPKCFALYSVDEKAVKLAEGKTKNISEICENKLTYLRTLSADERF